MFCKNCGRELREGSKFCSVCGAKVIPEENAGTAASQPAKMQQPQNSSAAQMGAANPRSAAGSGSSDLARKFRASDRVEEYLAIDKTNQLICVNQSIYIPWSQIISFERLKDETQVNRHGVRKVRRLKQVDKATEIGVKIVTRNPAHPQIRIDLISRAVKKDTNAYRTAEANAQKIMTLMTIVMDSVKSSQVQASHTVVNQVSAAEEIQKYKSLLDSGIISREEFDAKKIQLLGLA